MRQSANSKRNFVNSRTLCVVYSRLAPPWSRTSQSRRRPSRSTRRSVWVYARRCRWTQRLGRYLYSHRCSVRRRRLTCVLVITMFHSTDFSHVSVHFFNQFEEGFASRLYMKIGPVFSYVLGLVFDVSMPTQWIWSSSYYVLKGRGDLN